MRILGLVGGICLALVAVAGCGSSGDDESSQAAREAQEARIEAREQAALRAERRAQAQAARRAERRKAQRETARQRAREEAAEKRREEEQAEEESETSAGASKCHPSYEGACLDPLVSDYDCLGGSGDGPLYTGTVTVVGPDEYDLDRNGDGVGCEP